MPIASFRRADLYGFFVYFILSFPRFQSGIQSLFYFKNKNMDSRSKDRGNDRISKAKALPYISEIKRCLLRRVVGQTFKVFWFILFCHSRGFNRESRVFFILKIKIWIPAQKTAGMTEKTRLK